MNSVGKNHYEFCIELLCILWRGKTIMNSVGKRTIMKSVGKRTIMNSVGKEPL